MVKASLKRWWFSTKISVIFFNFISSFRDEKFFILLFYYRFTVLYLFFLFYVSFISSFLYDANYPFYFPFTQQNPFIFLLTCKIIYDFKFYIILSCCILVLFNILLMPITLVFYSQYSVSFQNVTSLISRKIKKNLH